MKTKYILTSQNTKGSVNYEYEDGILCGLQVSEDAELTRKQRIKILLRTAVNEAKLNENLRLPGCILTLVPADLSFERFWKEYNNPASKKKYTESLWNQRTDAEKVQMFDFLPKYKAMKRMEGTQMVYASTYINQENWKV
ncbi:MAG: hypothetical protein GX159_09715 [Flavobacteriaceae bacterium]|jgi:hypothetical protein|nr:hypothetical protein [Flavobacteriaceae bacterium]